MDACVRFRSSLVDGCDQAADVVPSRLGYGSTDVSHLAIAIHRHSPEGVPGALPARGSLSPVYRSHDEYAQIYWHWQCGGSSKWPGNRIDGTTPV